MKTDTILKAVVLNGEDKVLLLRRSATDTRRPGQWDLPGGLWEQGEDLIAGLTREVAEESGLLVASPQPIFTKTEVSSWEDNGINHRANVCRIYFALRVTDILPLTLSHEHDSARWTTLAEASDLLVYHRHKEVINYILNNQLEL